MLKGPGRTARSQVGHGRNGSDSGTQCCGLGGCCWHWGTLSLCLLIRVQRGGGRGALMSLGLLGGPKGRGSSQTL